MAANAAKLLGSRISARTLTATSPNTDPNVAGNSLALEFHPAVFTPSEPITHRSNLSADNLRLNDCRQLFAFGQRQAEISGAAQSSRSISSTPVSETTLDPSLATSFSRHISFAIAPPVATLQSNR
jgi:hypothetical protein